MRLARPSPASGRGLLGDRRLRARRPQRPVLDVERLQEVPHGGGRGQRVPEQRGQGLILAERREILAAVPAARPERDQALDELRRASSPRWRCFTATSASIVAATPSWRNSSITSGTPARPVTSVGSIGVIDLERQPGRVLRHRVPPCECCTHWVNGSKPDATCVGRMGGGFTRDPLTLIRSLAGEQGTASGLDRGGAAGVLL